MLLQRNFSGISLIHWSISSVQQFIYMIYEFLVDILLITSNFSEQCKADQQQQNKQTLFLIKRYIINALSTVQWDTHIDWIRWTHTYIHRNTTHIHTFIQAVISTQIHFLFHAYTHSHLCGSCEQTISPQSSDQFVLRCSWTVHWLQCQFRPTLVHPVVPFSSRLSHHFISSMERNVGVLCDRRDFHALDHNNSTPLELLSAKKCCCLTSAYISDKDNINK